MIDLAALEAEARSSLAEAGDEAALEAWRVAWLGRKGRLTAVLRGVGDLPADERPLVGSGANRLKGLLEAAITTRQRELTEAASVGSELDVTLPGRPPPLGSLHPVTLTRRILERTFRDMGFDVVEGPDVELEEYNFDRLRIPAGHPARDMWDTIWVADDGSGGPR